MVHKSIKFKDSASIEIYGDAETIHIDLYHGTKRVTSHTIHLYPGFWESVFPSYCEFPIILMNEERKLVAFQCRIRKCIKSYSSWAESIVKQDEIDQEYAKKRDVEKAEMSMSVEKLIDNMIEKNNWKTSQ